MNDIILALQTTQHVLKQSGTTAHLIKVDRSGDMYIGADDDRVYIRELPQCVIPMLYKLYDYEQTELSPDQVEMLVSRWCEV